MSDQAQLSRGQWLVLLAAFLGWMFDGLEMGIFRLVARPALQEMQAAAGMVGEGERDAIHGGSSPIRGWRRFRM